MAGRAISWLLWRCLLAATVVLSTGCHLLFGSFETKDTADDPASLVGLCDKGTFRCKEEVLLACSADQRSWVRKDTCASSDQCDSKNGVCTICQQADMMRCSGATRESCSTDRASWTTVDKCPSSETCSPNGCGPCPVPGALQCAVDISQRIVLKECDPTSKLWVTVSTCPNDVVCMATMSLAQTDPLHWDRAKCEGKCPPGQSMCEGSTLYRCPSSGLDWMSVAPCANEELCQVTLGKITKSTDMGASIDTCDQGCGTPGTARCTGNNLERCSADRLSWQLVMQCPTGLQCSTTGEGGCILCTPGEFQCNGQFLEQCSADHVWERKDDCLQAALCTLAADGNGVLTSGSCREPVCPRPGTFSCASETDPKLTPGKALYFCDTDQTAIGLRDTCVTEQLCNGPDGECKAPLCTPGQRRCGPTNTLEVQVCNVGQTGFDTVATCAAGEFCDPTDAAQPCKHECPAALFCNDRFLMACSSAQGVMQRGECQTRELCECGLNKTCPAGTLPDGCGVPVCGENLANFRCTDSAGTAAQGPLLQACKPGRDGWATATAENCGSSALCYPGPAPYYTNGYCATCPIAGEVACDATATNTRTCSTTRQSWTNQMPCGFGCVVDSSTTDYCASCTANELRCSGDLNQLLSCSADRKSTSVLRDCPFGCVNSGTTDSCGICGVNEKRCAGSAPGSLLQTCNADQQGLGMNVTCPNGCIDSGRADYCSDCVVGTTQCSGAGVRTCGADGHWGAVAACTNGCAVGTNGAAFCSGCAQNERRCSGSTLQECAPDRVGFVNPQPCSFGCVDSDLMDYCAACTNGELRCNGAGLEQCTADRTRLMALSSCDYGCIDSGTADHCAACVPNELRCDGDTLLTCTADQTGLILSKNCTNGCYDSGTVDYCRDCRPGQTRCATGGMQTCGSNGRWGAATACANATSCFGTEPTAYCGDCNPGDRRCSNSTVLTCDAVGHWPASSTEDCQRGCIDSGNSDYCAECSPGDTSCSGSMLLTCNAATGRYATTGSNCAMGCFGTTPAAECGVCNSGDSQCSATGSTRQECNNGRFSDVESCTNGCINSGNADFCALCPMGAAECVMSGTSRRTCVDGVWTAATPCPNQACVGTDCAACSPNATQCAAGDPTSVRTCSSAGAWGTPMLCPNRACAHDVCVDCMPNSTDCADDTNLITCSSQGSWGAPSPCSTMACVGTGCVDCQPRARECVDSARQRVCDDTGHWVTTDCADQGQAACVGTACAECMPGTEQCTATSTVRTCSAQGAWLSNEESCTYGCQDNGDADFCTVCPDGRSECVDTTMIRSCQGTWMTTGCPNGCFDAAPETANDYCRDCALGETDCRTDTQARICDAQGHWADGELCANYCLKGTCVDCRPGSTMCTEDATGLLTCSEVGSWSATAEDCPNGCANDGAKDACVLL